MKSAPKKVVLRRSKRNKSKFKSLEEAQIKKAHAAITKVWPKGNAAHMPCLDACQLTHKYYKESAPSQVKLLVLSESPNYTNPLALGVKAVVDDDSHHGHVNLVHCTSYGENWMLPEEFQNDRSINAGTRQFWRLFSVLAGDQDILEEGNDPLEQNGTIESFNAIFSHIQPPKSQVKAKQVAARLPRLQAKKKVMEAMRQRGILLADVCPSAIYKGGNKVWRKNKKTGHRYFTNANKMTTVDYNNVIKAAWEQYASHMIQTYRPKNVLLLGKDIQKAIGSDVIQAACGEIGGKFLGTTQHPSYSHIGGRKFLPHLRLYREIAQQATRNRDPAPIVLSEDLQKLKLLVPP